MKDWAGRQQTMRASKQQAVERMDPRQPAYNERDGAGRYSSRNGDR